MMSPDQAKSEIERLKLTLHALIRRRADESEQGESIREAILDRWDFVPENDRRLLNQLSGDLYVLAGEEHLEPGTVAEAAALVEASRDNDWRTVRELARRTLPGITEAHRLSLRARAWERLGFPEAAEAFRTQAWVDRCKELLRREGSGWISPCDHEGQDVMFSAWSAPDRRAVRVLKAEGHTFTVEILRQGGLETLVVRCGPGDLATFEEMLPGWLEDGQARLQPAPPYAPRGADMDRAA